jgi:hypothetical protein
MSSPWFVKTSVVINPLYPNKIDVYRYHVNINTEELGRMETIVLSKLKNGEWIISSINIIPGRSANTTDSNFVNVVQNELNLTGHHNIKLRNNHIGQKQSSANANPATSTSSSSAWFQYLTQTGYDYISSWFNTN